MLEDPSSDPDRATQRCQTQHTQVGHTAAEGTGETKRGLQVSFSSCVRMFSVLQLHYGHAKLPNMSKLGDLVQVEAERPAVWPGVIRVGLVQQKSVKF